MEMTFDEYIQNPMGVKTAVVPGRSMYKELYTKKWDMIILREREIKYTLYKSKTDFFAYFKIPSEVLDKFYYDVVIRFYPSKQKKGSLVNNTLNDYNVQFFSNDPSFVYTFCHAFVKNGLFINDLSERMNKLALKHVGKERNPQDLIGYVKSLYFAYLEMNRQKLFKKEQFSSAEEYNKSKLLKLIMDTDEKIDLRRTGQIKNNRDEKKSKVSTNVDKDNKEDSIIKSKIIQPIKKITGKSKIKPIKKKR